MRASLRVCFFLLLPSGSVMAQELDGKVAKGLGDEKVLKGKEKGTKDGWAVKLHAGATGAYNHSSKVVGAVDGSTVQLGFLIDFAADLTAGLHAWENKISLKENQSRTPQIDSFIKSADELRIDSTYIYRMGSLTWLGLFGRGGLSTQLLHGYDIRAEPVTITRNRRDGTQVTKNVRAQTRFALTKPLEPLFLKESTGLVAKPVATERITFKAKVGVGLQHVVVRDGFSLAEDTGTELSFNQLQDSTQAGGLMDLDANGAMAENVSWSTFASYFYPFAGEEAEDLEGVEASSVELGAKLSVALSTWMSLDYVLSAKYLPQIVDEWQVANGVTLVVGLDMI